MLELNGGAQRSQDNNGDDENGYSEKLGETHLIYNKILR